LTIAQPTGAADVDDKWKEVREGFDKWLKITCYLALFGVGFRMLQYLPVHIAERIIEAFLEYIGI
jgi:hypothetical protein